MDPVRPSGPELPDEPADVLADELAGAGFVAPAAEAAALRAAADAGRGPLDELVARRLTGEPLAWIVGQVAFCGLTLRVDRGVYVPRPHTELLARRAVARLPPDGVAVDLCTGAGAVAAALAAARPGARVVATDIDPAAVACARANGVDARLGDLFAPWAAELSARPADVVVGVVPYVPTGSLGLLHRDTLAFEPLVAFDGGRDGGAVLRRVVADGARALRPGGALILELGGDEAALLADDLAAAGFGDVALIVDEEGDVRGVEATRELTPRAATRTG